MSDSIQTLTTSTPDATFPTRAAIYCRVSSQEQADGGTSLDSQEARCRGYCDDHNYEIVQRHCYREVHTGSEYRERYYLSELRQALRNREIDVVVAYAVDRLGRDQAHLAILIEEADDAGVRYEFVTEDFENSAVGKFIRSAKSFVAEIELEKIRERTMRGKRERVMSGRPLAAGRAPYGFQWRDDDRTGLEANPATAPIIQEVYRRYASGETLRSVAAWLNVTAPTPTGRGRWHAETIREMLTKHIYTGRYYSLGWSKRKAGSPQRFDIEKAILLPEGTAPRLVDDATFAAVQERFGVNAQHAIRSAKNPEGALLRTGYAKCGYCGRTMVTRPRKSGAHEYVCRAGTTDKICERHAMSATVLDPIVWKLVADRLKDPLIIRRELEQLRNDDPTMGDLEQIERAIAEAERQRGNLARAIAVVTDADASAPLVTELQHVNDRHRALTAERQLRETEREQWQRSQLDLDSLEDWCSLVAENIDALDWKQKRLALDALGVTVKVWRSDHEPRYEVNAIVPVPVVTGTT